MLPFSPEAFMGMTLVVTVGVAAAGVLHASMLGRSDAKEEASGPEGKVVNLRQWSDREDPEGSHVYVA